LNQQVTGVGTVAEALRALASDEFDVMFTDLSMPGTDGLTLAATARRRAPGLWIVLATGYGQGLPPNSTDAGVVDRVINKPFDLSQIEAALQALGDR
ncbi:MAG: response regulator, partial [Pyrinomonadaceae bacterium]